MLSRLTVALVSLLLATPVIIFWLWLLILPSSVEIQCPEECMCERDGYFVECSGSGLNSIPSNLPKNLLHLVLDDNNIPFLKKDNFVSKGLVELRIIKAQFCKIKYIEEGAFNGLTNLTHLFLEGNEISEITPDTFEKNCRLEYLDLDNNRIEHLEPDIFYGLVNLQDIYLEENNLHYLHPDTFLGLPNLQILFLSQNFDLQIPTDRHFINSLSLKYFNIELCNIRSVSVETFANVTALERLYLTYNYLKSLDINILKALPQLSTLYICGNPLHCDCHLQEVWRWCKDHNIETEYMEIVPECDTPSEVNGIWWGVLEKGQCLQGNIHYFGDYNNTRYNYTPTEDTELNTKTIMWEIVTNFIDKYKLPLYAVLFTFGTAGNIIIITRNKDMRTVPNMYILNLAVNDIIFLMVLFFENILQIDMSPRIDFMCIFFTFVYQMSINLTAYSIALLSFQRYRVIVNSLQFHVSPQPTWRSTGATICGVWIIAAVFAVPSARTQDFCDFRLFFWFTNYIHLATIFCFLVSCVFPLCVITFSYVMTFRHLLKTRFSLSETQNAQLNTRKKTAKVVLGLTFVFLFSYVPLYIYEMCIFLRLDFEKSSTQLIKDVQELLNSIPIGSIVDFLLPINSCLNPVSLFFTSLAFRSHFKRYLTCCCKTKSPPTDFELTRRN